MRILALTLALAGLAAGNTFAQAPSGNLPKIVEKNGRHQLRVDGRPFFVLGGQVHNSSAWPGMMPQVWAAADQLHLNTLEVPIYWEQIEPQQGKFDFSLLDILLAQARQHGVHLVLLWFGTWKNGSNHYMPAWMKQNAAKYPNITGKKDQPIDSPSPHSQATLDADIKTFTAVMSHLKYADAERTVIMVQVENETGSWGSVRDYSPAAQKLFESPVPQQMLKPELLSP
jgi:beta-galactosidase GanA